MKLILVIIIFTTSILASANTVECRVIQRKGAEVLDKTFVMELDYKILSFSFFENYISTITWPQSSKQMTILFGKEGHGFLSESIARVSVPGESITAISHISRNDRIQISCLSKKKPINDFSPNQDF